MENEIENLINNVKECAREVYQDLGAGWEEVVYHKAMEVALRERGISYESKRVLPVSFKGHIVGEGYPDLIVWTKSKKGKRIAIVFDFKSTQDVQEDHRAQVAKYIQELKKQIEPKEKVYEIGFIIDFTAVKSNKIKNGIEDIGGVKILKVKTS